SSRFRRAGRPAAAHGPLDGSRGERVRAGRSAARAAGGPPAAFYLRLALKDAPGVLARVAAALGEADVSIHQMRQDTDDAPAGEATVVIVTHETSRAALDAALGRIEASGVAVGAPVAIRIEPL
ncbi:MAG: ACT domain-containing protein, partial [Pseudomonadota bacterium]